MSVTVVPERIAHWPEQDEHVYHLPVGRFSPEAEWQPIWCGEGIVFPYRETRSMKDVCEECKTAKKNRTEAVK